MILWLKKVSLEYGACVYGFIYLPGIKYGSMVEYQKNQFMGNGS